LIYIISILFNHNILFLCFLCKRGHAQTSDLVPLEKKDRHDTMATWY